MGPLFLLYQKRNHHQHYKMMKLVVLALALSAASAGTVYTGLPGYHGAYSGLPLGYAGAYSGLPVVAKSPITYTAAAAPTLVAPSPYRVHTGVKTEVKVEPVEQHGYVV